MSADGDSADVVRAALARVIDPEIRRPITELDMVRDVSVQDGVAAVDLRLTIVGCPAADRIESDVRAAVLGVQGIESLALLFVNHWIIKARENLRLLTAADKELHQITQFLSNHFKCENANILPEYFCLNIFDKRQLRFNLGNSDLFLQQFRRLNQLLAVVSQFRELVYLREH